jgi:hypothetical protein
MFKNDANANLMVANSLRASRHVSEADPTKTVTRLRRQLLLDTATEDYARAGASVHLRVELSDETGEPKPMGAQLTLETAYSDPEILMAMPIDCQAQYAASCAAQIEQSVHMGTWEVKFSRTVSARSLPEDTAVVSLADLEEYLAGINAGLLALPVSVPRATPLLVMESTLVRSFELPFSLAKSGVPLTAVTDLYYKNITDALAPHSFEPTSRSQWSFSVPPSGDLQAGSERPHPPSTTPVRPVAHAAAGATRAQELLSVFGLADELSSAAWIATSALGDALGAALGIPVSAELGEALNDALNEDEGGNLGPLLGAI